MANSTKPLTNTEVLQAKTKKKEYSLSDGRGLALRIKPNGSKYWIFNFSRPYTKKRANISFGRYPDVSLKGARSLRDDAQKLLAKNIDPQKHRVQEKAKDAQAHKNTLEHIAAQWLEIKKTEVSPAYARNIWHSFENHIFPTLGKLPLHELTARETIEAIKPVTAKGSLETVKRLCQRLNEVMVWAVNTGLIASNPLAAIGKAFQAPTKRSMPTLKPEQLPELMKTVATASIKLTTRCLSRNG